jgi:hypothetical protein
MRNVPCSWCTRIITLTEIQVTGRRRVIPIVRCNTDGIRKVASVGQNRRPQMFDLEALDP